MTQVSSGLTTTQALISAPSAAPCAAAGATSNFAGSGGAIVGTYEDEAMFGRLVEGMRPVGAAVIKPKIVS